MQVVKQQVPKDILIEEAKGIEIKQGNFVTIYDSRDVVDTYYVDRIIEDKAMIIGLKLTPEKDDVLPSRIMIDTNRLIYIDDSFVNIDGALWNLRKQSFPKLS